MAFQVEDGTGLSTANAYITVVEFKAHHTDRNVAAVVESDFLDTEIQAGIINATDYIDKRFGRRFRGWRTSRAQGLEWPRSDAYDDDEYSLPDLPTQLKKATAEYALIALQLARNLAPIPGLPFPVIDPSTGDTSSAGGGQLKRSTDKVGPIEETREYATGQDQNQPMRVTGNLSQNIPEYPQADLWIEELLKGRGSRELRRG